MNEIETHFIGIEEIIASAKNLKDLKAFKIEFINNYRLTLAYFNHIQEVIEQEIEGE